MVERPKNETDSESGAGEGDASGRGLRAAISAYGLSEGEPELINSEAVGFTRRYKDSEYRLQGNTGVVKEYILELASVRLPLRHLSPAEH